MKWVGEICRTIRSAIEEDKRTPRLIAVVCTLTLCIAVLLVVSAAADAMFRP